MLWRHFFGMRRLLLKDFVPPGQFFHFARSSFERPEPVDFHEHDFYEIFWVEEGAGWHYLREEKRPLRTGVLVLVRDRDYHALSATSGGTMRIANLAFSPRLWEELLARYFPGYPDPMRAPAPEREFEFSYAETHFPLGQAGRLSSAPSSRAPLDLFLMELLWLRLRPGVASMSAAGIPDWLVRACHDVRNPENLPEGTAAFVRLAGRSADHVARMTRKYLGRSPTEIVNEARLTHAASRLLLSDDTILNIAADSGIANLAHFYKLFNARFGVTPRRYRLRARRITGGS